MTTRRFIGVRWWLGAAFALVAAVSTAIVVAQFSSRSENAFRVHAEDLAVVSAGNAAKQLDHHALTQGAVTTVAERQDLELRLFDRQGRLLFAGKPSSGSVRDLELEQRAKLTALAGGRAHDSTSDGKIFVVGIPMRNGALVALSERPDVAAAIGILNDQALRAGVIAGVIGVLVGLLLAQLIALRLRRLSRAAEAIAAGDFERSVRYRFHDEFGALAQNFDRMRRQLRRSFRHIEGERDRLRLLLERLHEGVVTVDQTLTVQFANTEARRVLGTRLDEGDQLPEPWDGFSLREFAAGLFE